MRYYYVIDNPKYMSWWDSQVGDALGHGKNIQSYDNLWQDVIDGFKLRSVPPSVDELLQAGRQISSNFIYDINF